MAHNDFTPLYRTMVGFDRLANMMDNASRLDGTQGYPPYNIERVGNDAFAVEIAVAGFSESDIDIETKESMLTVTAKKSGDKGDNSREFVHRGIAERSFVRRFQLADHIVVTSAALQNGLLRIELIREIPEELKARKIAIGKPSLRQVGRPTVVDSEQSKAA